MAVKVDADVVEFCGIQLASKRDVERCKILNHKFADIIDNHDVLTPDVVTAHAKFRAFITNTQIRVAGELRSILIAACVTLGLQPKLFTSNGANQRIVAQSTRVRLSTGKSRELPLVLHLDFRYGRDQVGTQKVDIVRIRVQSWAAYKSAGGAMWYDQSYRTHKVGLRKLMLTLVRLNQNDLSYTEIDTLMAAQQHKGPEPVATLSLYRQKVWDAADDRAYRLLWLTEAKRVAANHQGMVTNFDAILTAITSELRRLSKEIHLDGKGCLAHARSQEKGSPTLEEVVVRSRKIRKGEISVEVVREWFSIFWQRWETNSIHATISFLTWPIEKCTLADVQLNVTNRPTRPIMVTQLDGFGNVSKIALQGRGFTPTLMQALLHLAHKFPTPPEPRGLRPGVASEVILCVKPGSSLWARRPYPYIHAWVHDTRFKGTDDFEVSLTNSTLLDPYLPLKGGNGLGWHRVFQNKDLIFMHDEERVQNEFGRGASAKVEEGCTLKEQKDVVMSLEGTRGGQSSAKVTLGLSISTPPHDSRPVWLKNLPIQRGAEERTPERKRVLRPLETTSGPPKSRHCEQAAEEKIDGGIVRAIQIPTQVQQSYDAALIGRFYGEPLTSSRQNSPYEKYLLFKEANTEYELFLGRAKTGKRRREEIPSMGVIYIACKTGFDGKSVWTGKLQKDARLGPVPNWDHNLLGDALMAAFPNQQPIATQIRRDRAKQWKANGKTLKAHLKEWYCSH